MKARRKEQLAFLKLTEENVRRNIILQIIIVTLSIVLFLRVWPMGLVKEHTVSKQQAMTGEEYSSEASFVIPDKKLQGVKFAQEHLYQITLYMSCVTYEKDDYVIFRLYDDRFSCIYEERAVCNLIMREQALMVTPDMDVIPGKDYYYEILIPDYEGMTRQVTQQLILPIADKELLAQEENQILYIDGIYNDKQALIADFDYTNAIPGWKIILTGLFVVICSFAAYILFVLLLGKCSVFLVENGRAIRIGISVLVLCGTIGLGVLIVVHNIFGGSTMDRVVYGIGIIAALCCALCAVWYIGTKRIELKHTVAKQASLMWRNYLQTVFFGLAVHSVCQYVNADREYIHIINTRWMLIFLGLALLVTHSEKLLRNLFSYLWMGLSLAGVFIYYFVFAQGDAEALYVIRLTLAVIVIWGMVLINVFLQLKKECWKYLSKPFFATWLLFLGFMIYWRADRIWIFTATLPFAVILLYNLSATARVRVLKNFTNGVFVSFALYILFCMHHRPYNAWLLYRYGGLFHTVACTGMYLALVAAVALGRLYGKWKKQERMLADGWKELIVFAVSASGIMLTMSRTAMLTIAVNYIVVFVLALIVYKKTVKQLVKEVGLLAAACVLCFALTFSATRMIPALINDPVYYSLEEQYIAHNVQKGDAINDGEKYMSFDRYLAVLLGRFQIASEQTVEYSDQAADTVVDNTVDESTANDNNEAVTKPQEKPVDSYVVEVDEDITNGRLDIYMGYLDALELHGHDKMALPLEDGKEYVHAHNSYLQVAYDFGIPAGIVFLVLCAFTLWRSIYFVYKYGKKNSIYLVAFSVIIAFGFISVTEWAFHPCIPIGFVFLVMQMLLMQEPEVKEK